MNTKHVSPDGPEHWPVFFDKVRGIWSKPGWGISQSVLATVKAAVLLVFGDLDFTSVEEAAMIFHIIPGAQLCILPGVGHGTFLDRPEWFEPGEFSISWIGNERAFVREIASVNALQSASQVRTVPRCRAIGAAQYNMANQGDFTSPQVHTCGVLLAKVR
jgi:hypothetical protein